MIHLGRPLVYLYPNSGVIFENWGGVITFNGPCIIGNASAISVGEKGYLSIGGKFKATTSLKIACYHNINIAKNVLVGWDCLIADSDFHVLTNCRNGTLTTGYAPIEIGENTWIAMKCTILKGSVLPKCSVLSACTLYAGVKDSKEYSVISSSVSPYTKIEGLYRNIDNDQIIYK